jgi:hypothetical protein
LWVSFFALKSVFKGLLSAFVLCYRQHFSGWCGRRKKWAKNAFWGLKKGCQLCRALCPVVFAFLALGNVSAYRRFFYRHQVRQLRQFWLKWAELIRLPGAV